MYWQILNTNRLRQSGAWPERSFQVMLADSGFVSIETANYAPNKRTHNADSRYPPGRYASLQAGISLTTKPHPAQ